MARIGTMALRPPYSPSRYDKHFCLKPPALLWAALFYLSRAITLPVVLGLTSLAGTLAGEKADIRSIFEPVLDLYSLPPSLIAAAVLFALARRSPRASSSTRWIWAHGRMLLAASAALDLVLVVVSTPLGHGEITEQTKLPLLAVIFDLYFFAYILSARHVRAVFSDFPDPAPAAGTSK